MTVTVTVATTAVTVVADLVRNLFGHLLFHLEGDRVAVLVGDLLTCLSEVAIFNKYILSETLSIIYMKRRETKNSGTDLNLYLIIKFEFCN
jgi:hypothetical protein